MSGMQFLAQAKLMQPAASRILITAYVELDTILEAINRGEIYRFVSKPFVREEFLATVKTAVQRYALIRQNEELHEATQGMNAQLSDINRILKEQMEHVAAQNLQLESLNRALERNLEGTIELCFRQVEMFYPTLGRQARRTHALCDAMAALLNLPGDRERTLGIAAWLYDVGLVGMPRPLVRRWQLEPQMLTPEQRTLILQHPILGEELVELVPQLDEVGAMIRAHHERYDGAGYPDQLQGDQIPWLARLLGTAAGYAEVVDRGGDGEQHLHAGSGTLYDPEAVRLLLRCLPHLQPAREQKEVLLAELRPGMVIARGIANLRGMLLLPEGQVLTEAWINKLHAHNRITPIAQSLFVYM
jgi:response regulator RpfG family c-di-GMP phosphodiesterase